MLGEALDDTNPFLDCTSSEIGKNSNDTVVNNSMEVDFTSLVTSTIPPPSSPPKTSKHVHSLKSIERKDTKEIKPRKKVVSPNQKLTKSSRVS